MAILTSPGISVSVTDNSFYVPRAGSTTPLIVIATGQNKKQVVQNTLTAPGSNESNVLHEITSVSQLLELYGKPKFLANSAGQQFHGDARNEYGLQTAVNFLRGPASKIYVIRANVNLDDNITNIRTLWKSYTDKSATSLENAINTFITDINIAAHNTDKTTITASELITLAQTSLATTFEVSSFKTLETDLIAPATPLKLYANGYDKPSTGTYPGLTAIANDLTTNTGYSGGGTNPGEFTSAESKLILQEVSNKLTTTIEFQQKTSLGANDAARRITITAALSSAISSNQDIRSTDSLHFDLVAAPGYPEVADELVSLVQERNNETLVVGDVPMNIKPEQVTNPTTGWAVSSKRQNRNSIAYYYPHGINTTLDGTEVLMPSSAMALVTIAQSDNLASIYHAPMGIRRAIVDGYTNIGYAKGIPGDVTEFVPIKLNDAQSGSLYSSGPNGKINPIRFYPGEGITIMGQKTSSPTTSSLDRVKAVRTLYYIKRALRTRTRSFIGEINDENTRSDLKSVVDTFLSTIMQERGIDDFATKCDISNNTPSVLARQELVCEIAVSFSSTAEFIYFPITVKGIGEI